MVFKIFKNHMESIHYSKALRENKNQCKICAKWYKNLFRHMQMVHTPIIEQYACNFEGCQKIFHQQQYLKAHQKIHCQTKVVCDQCNTILSGNKTLKMHMQTVHSGKKFRCECDKKFSRKDSLKRHKQNCKIYQRIKEKTSA